LRIILTLHLNIIVIFDLIFLLFLIFPAFPLFFSLFLFFVARPFPEKLLFLVCVLVVAVVPVVLLLVFAGLFLHRYDVDLERQLSKDLMLRSFNVVLIAFQGVSKLFKDAMHCSNGFSYGFDLNLRPFELF